jgi:hypothetical protein
MAIGAGGGESALLSPSTRCFSHGCAFLPIAVIVVIWLADALTVRPEIDAHFYCSQISHVSKSIVSISAPP